MIILLDGPAANTPLALHRAPRLLRVVIGRGGKIDALDQVGDEPRPHERIVVYRAVEAPTWIHVSARGRGGKALRGMWPTCRYQVLPDAYQPDDATARDNVAWSAWAFHCGPELCADLLPSPERQSLEHHTNHLKHKCANRNDHRIHFNHGGQDAICVPAPQGGSMAKRKPNTGDALAEAGANPEAGGLFDLFSLPPAPSVPAAATPSTPSLFQETDHEPQRHQGSGENDCFNGADAGTTAAGVHQQSQRPIRPAGRPATGDRPLQAGGTAGRSRIDPVGNAGQAEGRVDLVAGVEYRTLSLWPRIFDVLQRDGAVNMQWDTSYRGELLILLSLPPFTEGEYRLVGELYDVRPCQHELNDRFRFCFRNLRPVVPRRGDNQLCIGRVVFQGAKS